MSCYFLLNPDISLLNQYGYVKYVQNDSIWITRKLLKVEIESIYNEEERDRVKSEFNSLVQEYELSKWYDTLLFIALIESDKADQRFQSIMESYNHSKRDKELANLLLLFEESTLTAFHSLKLNTYKDTALIKDTKVINWIGELIKSSIQEQSYSLNILGTSMLNFNRGNDGEVSKPGEPLNYKHIYEIANQTMRKPGVRERNQCLTGFLVVLLNFIQNETPLKSHDDIKFSDRQVKFLFRIAEIFGWLSSKQISAPDKDYMQNLLTKYVKLK